MEWAGEADAGVIVENVEAAEVLDSSGDIRSASAAFDTSTFSAIALPPLLVMSAATAGRDPRPIGDHDACALAGEKD